MKLGRTLPLLALLFSVACAPVSSNMSSSPISSESLENIETPLPTEEEEHETMIAARLEQQAMREAFRSGLISTTDRCRTGFVVPDAVTPGVIALTFDDGPNPATTNKILDILKARGVKASFFILGSRAKAYPAIVKRIYDEGHLVANHSYSHKNFQSLTQAQTDYEIKTPHGYLSPYMTTGKFFRYPYGMSSCYGNDVLKSMAYQQAVGWHVDSCDWAMTDGNFSESEAKACYTQPGPVNFQNHVMNLINAEGGGILLLHDIHANTANNVNQLITNLMARKFKFVRIDNKTYFPKLNKDLFRAAVEKLKSGSGNAVTPVAAAAKTPAPAGKAQKRVPKKLPEIPNDGFMFLGE